MDVIHAGFYKEKHMISDDFLLYDRITYTIMYFSRDITLEFIVTLASKRSDGNRQFFHSEFEKTSNYRLTDLSRTIRIRPRSYFCINIKDNFDGGFVLKPSDVYILLKAIEDKVLKWFFGSKRIFSIVDDNLVITGKYTQFMYPQSEYKYLAMIPVVHQFEDQKFKEGVRMFINSPDIYVDMTIDDLLGFLQVLRNTDTVTLTAVMCNYVKSLPYGSNMGKMGQGLGVSAYRDTSYEPQQLPPKNSGTDFLSNTKTK